MPEARTISIRINEQPRQVTAAMTLRALWHATNPQADLVILNGFPVVTDGTLANTAAALGSPFDASHSDAPRVTASFANTAAALGSRSEASHSDAPRVTASLANTAAALGSPSDASRSDASRSCVPRSHTSPADAPLADGDEVVFIQRGAVPAPEELEALLVARHGPGVHEKLKRGHVGIAGCGGLGSTLAVALARSGVGTLTLVDFDVVEPSNLNRQQYFIDQLGEPKVQALAANLHRINPYVTLRLHLQRLTKADVPTLFSDCSVVAECFDTPAAKAELSSAMRRSLPDIPLVAVSGIAGYGPASAIVSRRVFGNHFLIGDRATAAAPGRGLLAPKVTVAAGHQANVVLRLLLGAIAAHEGE